MQECQVQEQVLGQEVKKEIDGKQVAMEIRSDPFVKEEDSQVQERLWSRKSQKRLMEKRKR